MKNKLPKADYKGQINIGDLSISCAVLDTGERVLVDRSLATVLGIKGSGAYWKRKKEKKGTELPEYISTNYLAPFIDEETKEKLLKTIVYTDSEGEIYEGVSAALLVDICDIWQRADQKGALENRANAKLAAQRAYSIFKGFTTIGITALVDEATGYQDVREKRALEKILNKFLQDESRKWSKTFPDDFWYKLVKIKGYNNYMAMKRPAFVGHWVNDIVYARLAPGVKKKLKELNPRTPKGNRKGKHHQHLTEDFGLPELKDHLNKVMVLMDAASNKKEFDRLLNRSLPKYGDTIELDLDNPNE